MGSSASKAGRKLPKRTETPKWAGVRTPDVNPPTNHPTASRLANEFKTTDIEKDARDPDFIANLNRLGPVRVDHHMKTISTEASNADQLFKSRAQSEAEASSSQRTKNRLHAPTLSQLLDERKAARTEKDLEQLCTKYGIDQDKVASLARFVSSPSIDGRTAVRTTAKDGEEGLTVKAIWVEPSLVFGRSQHHI